MKDLPKWLREYGGERTSYESFGGAPDWFWAAIDAIRAAPELAEAALNSLPRERLRQFYFAYRELTDELYGDYCDDERGWHEDDILTASSWVVNQGEPFYRAVYEDLRLYPDPSEVPPSDLSGLVAEVSRKRFGEELCG
ncbi:hypothetical protein VT84_14440 [Gemmata sp. SH-PL17]|nr:hypothetical protein VT84_14440 [Gemmata sp. SH-PL17]